MHHNNALALDQLWMYGGPPRKNLWKTPDYTACSIRTGGHCAYPHFIGYRRVMIDRLINSQTLKERGQTPTFRFSAFLAVCLTASAVLAQTTPPMDHLSLTHLEERLTTIDCHLEKLAEYSLRSGIGPVGFRSKTHESSVNVEWIQIHLDRETPIDQIVLVPTIWRDTNKGFKDDGFPLEFSLIAGSDSDPNGTIIASFGRQDHLLPRIAPLVIPCPGIVASWVRVEATALSPRAWDDKYILQLDEILIFNGHTNVALRQPIRALSPDMPAVSARQIHFLVDGFVPYLMNAAEGTQSIAFVSKVGIGERPSLSIDLETIQPLSRIHLHVTELDDTVPTSTPVGFGIPRRLLVEGATEPDYSDAVPLVEYHMNTVYDTGPIIIRHFKETPCRYVRLTALEPYIHNNTPNASQIGFAEIELFAREQNVALAKTIRGDFDVAAPERSFSALTDGRNLYGRILPMRDWLNELALRHDLETERPAVLEELNRRYARQKTNLARLKWLTALLAAGILFTLLIDRIVRMRQVARIRHRFAADLHDELGANLHTIGLLSDLAQQSMDEPEELSMLHQRIRAVTEQTGTAVRHCTAMQEANGLYTGLVADMERASSRIMAKLEHDISIEGETFLEQLKPRTRADLFLFFKECLVNISRHSGATQFSTQLRADHKAIHLTVSDNGRGIENTKGSSIPSSLKRRARLLGARVVVKSPPTGGTSIVLTLRTQRWGPRK